MQGNLLISLTYVISPAGIMCKVNRDRYNIDAPGCKKKAYMDLDF